MMGLKHSPGPWRQSHPGNRITSILDADGALVVAGEEDGAMTPFASCDDSEEAVANANLVTAAPDLLKQLLQVQETIQKEDWALLQSEHAQTAIQWAINRAKGEA